MLAPMPAVPATATLTGLASAAALLLSRLGTHLTEPAFSPVLMVAVVTAFAVLLASRWAPQPARTTTGLSACW